MHISLKRLNEISIALHNEALKSKCRRKVACIITDAEYNTIGIGHNITNCTSCSSPSGSSNECCCVSHAEITAIRSLLSTSIPVFAYITFRPCAPCRNALNEIGITEIQVICDYN